MGDQPVGAVLAGGEGRRIGGAKAIVELDGRPLALRMLEIVGAVLDETVLVAKAETELPEARGLTLWIEPDEPRHPLAGIAHALRAAAGRAVFACAVDLPLLTPAVVRTIALAPADGVAAVVPRAGGRLQPLCALYTPLAMPYLASAPGNAPLTAVVERMSPAVIEFEDDGAFFNINSPEDLLFASDLLARRRRAEPAA